MIEEFQIHEFGEENKKILLMLHGSCMSWDMYEESISILKNNYHVIIPALPGYDFDRDTDFTSIEQICTYMENWLIQKGYAEIDGIYGLSMGGSLVIRFLADNCVKVKSAIIDAGITPYDYPWLVTRVIAVRDYLMLRLGQSSRKMLELVYSPERYTEEGISYLYRALCHMSRKTIWRTFESCNNYSMPDRIPKLDTEITYWYGSLEKKARKLDIAYVRKTYPETVFEEVEGMEHGEFCMMYPKAFAEKVSAFLG